MGNALSRIHPTAGRRKLQHSPQIPQRSVRKVLLTAGSPAYSRSARNRQDRPVTPEVAGSSPVAPVQALHIDLAGRSSSLVLERLEHVEPRCSPCRQDGRKDAGNDRDEREDREGQHRNGERDVVL
jgi:hypothetical protein